MGKVRLVDPAGRFMVPVIVDTRENLPFAFDGFVCDAKDGGGPLLIPTVVATLRTGDYSLRGFESRVTIERKSASDLYSTIGQGRERFERELARMAEMSFAAVMIEATEAELYTSPPGHTQLTPKTVSRSIDAWRVRYGVHFIAPGPRELAEVKTFRLLEKWAQEHLTQDEVTAVHALSGPGGI